MPWWPKSARSTTRLWHRMVNSGTFEKPVSDSTAEFTAIPASSACTQLHPMRTARFRSAGNVPPRTPKDARVSTIVGSPVRVPMQPTSASTLTPSKVPSRMIMIACEYGMPGTKSVPVSSVVTTMFAASQTMIAFPKPIVRSVSAPGSTVSWPSRAVIRSNTSVPPVLALSASLAGESTLVVDLHPVPLRGEVDGDEAHQRVRGEVGGHGPGGPTCPLDQGRGDDRGQGAAEHPGHLVAEGDPGVTHPRFEELRDKDPRDAVERPRRESPEAHSGPDQDRDLGVHEPEKGVGEQEHEGRAPERHGPPADAVGDVGEDQDARDLGHP